MGLFRSGASVLGVAFAAAAAYTVLGFYGVDEGERAVETRGGRITAIQDPGWHHRWPIIEGHQNYQTEKFFEIGLDNQNIYYSPDRAESDITVDPNGAVDTAAIATENSQQYTVHDFRIRASINPDHVRLLHTNYGSMNAIRSLVEDAGIEAYKSVVRELDPLEINSQRDTIGARAAERLQDRLNVELAESNIPAGAIDIESVRFLDFDFEQGVAGAYERANETRSNIQAAEFARQAEEINVERERLAGEAEAAREIARSEGQAQAIRNVGEALESNPDVLPIRIAEIWAEAGAPMPDTLVNGDGSGTLINVPAAPQNQPR